MGENAYESTDLCLAYCDRYKIPTTDAEKDDSLQAGLGEKEVEFTSLDLVAAECVVQGISTIGECGWFSVLQVCPE